MTERELPTRAPPPASASPALPVGKEIAPNPGMKNLTAVTYEPLTLVRPVQVNSKGERMTL